MPKVFVVGHDMAYERMFMANNWDITRDIEEASLIQFTGGEDVSPMLYLEPIHATTGSNPLRDAHEADIFVTYEGEVPFAGICRGGQFLCAINGGRLWQDVNNHAIGGEHIALDLDTNEEYPVSSTHHQMMDPSGAEDYSILVTAGLSTRKSDGWGNNVKQDLNSSQRDIEAVFFSQSNSLCFQPHPEFYDNNHPCQRLYFDLIKRHLNLEA